MTPKRIRLFQWIAILGALAAAGFGSRCAAQSKTPERSEGERLLMEMERKLQDAKSRSLRTRIALELPYLITETPSATGILKSYFRAHFLSAMDELDAPMVPEHSRGQFKAVVKEKLDGRDALKVEWHTERSVYGRGCMHCPPPKMIVQDKTTVWIDTATKLPLKQMSPNGTVEHYRHVDTNPKLDTSRIVQPASK